MPEAEIAARVLIVDDDPTMRLLTAATLEAAGFEVAQVDSGYRGRPKFGTFMTWGVCTPS